MDRHRDANPRRSVEVPLPWRFARRPRGSCINPGANAAGANSRSRRSDSTFVVSSPRPCSSDGKTLDRPERRVFFEPALSNGACPTRTFKSISWWWNWQGVRSSARAPLMSINKCRATGTGWSARSSTASNCAMPLLQQTFKRLLDLTGRAVDHREPVYAGSSDRSGRCPRSGRPWPWSPAESLQRVVALVDRRVARYCNLALSQRN